MHVIVERQILGQGWGGGRSILRDVSCLIRWFGIIQCLRYNRQGTKEGIPLPQGAFYPYAAVCASDLFAQEKVNYTHGKKHAERSYERDRAVVN